MRYWTVPAPQKIPLPSGIPAEAIPAEHPTIDHVQVFDGILWGDARFRGDWAETFEDLEEKISEAKPGAVVELSDRDHERVTKVLQEAKIDQRFVRPVTRIINSFVKCAKKDPRQPKEDAKVDGAEPKALPPAEN